MWDGGWYGWLFGPMMMILFIALLVVAVIVIARWLGADNRDISSGRIPDKTPLDILKERLAHGEIDRDEFEARRKLLE